MTTEDYKNINATLSTQPGVYKFIDADNIVLYVGKAKNIKKRIASYFGNKKHQANKTRVMVKNARRIEFTIVETEQDALLLENTLIKKYQPRYNVMLKDGKSYSYIRIKNERFPRVFLTRNVVKDGSTYFGPYTSSHRARTILELIKDLFPLRTCNLNLSETNIKKGKFKVCLEYHIKNCEGECVGKKTEEDYNKKIDQIKNMLRGHFGKVKYHLKEEMRLYAENLDFEKAQIIKEKIDAFENYQGKSTVVSTTIKDVDVFSITTDDKDAYVNYMKVINGALINAYTLEMTKNLNEDKKDLLAYAIPALREKFDSIAEEILVPFLVKLPDENIKIIVPKIGDKKKLVELSEKNVKYFLFQKKKAALNKQRKITSAERILKTLRDDLNMDELPLHIECFDNSNFQGAFPVSSCVVFKNAKPAKRDYRHYNVKTVEGPDDFASMEEVVYRRYKRLLKENKPLPQLIIIDGGKGQLSSAMKSLKALSLDTKITIIGIAKKLEEIYLPGDSIPIYINKKSESLKLIQQARDEAHRFAITFHRNKRSKDLTKTELTQIPGIGEKIAEKLLSHYGSVKKIKNTPIQELSLFAGRVIAKKVLNYLNTE